MLRMARWTPTVPILMLVTALESVLKTYWNSRAWSQKEISKHGLLGVGAEEQACKQSESKNRELIYTRSATVDRRPVLLLIGCDGRIPAV